MSNKAFIFDMDGVIIDSETFWRPKEIPFLKNLFGKEIYEQVKDYVVGYTTPSLYERARALGFDMDEKTFLSKYDKQAIITYKEAKMTKNLEKLLQKLVELRFKIGLVSASRPSWIEQVLSRIKNRKLFTYVLSLAQRQDLKQKPYPDGYLEAIKKLGSTANKTIILEDLQTGINASKATGAFTICFTEHLASIEIPQDADLYVNSIGELIDKVEDIKL